MVPSPLGNPIIFTHYIDTNLLHCCFIGRSVTGIIHFINGTPIDMISKKQNTVEKATYRSKFMAARTCVEQIIDLRTTLKYFGFHILGDSEMFGNNKLLVNSAMQFGARLHKRRIVLSFHRVCEAIAANIYRFTYLNTTKIATDVFSRHWGYSCVWKLLRPTLFWHGDTLDMPENNNE